MPATREDLVRIAREAVAGAHRPSYCANPAAFDPHEWILEAMARAYEVGRSETDQALAESLRLQSHYATLLNQYDGGQRMTFSDAGSWVARLRQISEAG